jgi:hypothetical protein
MGDGPVHTDSNIDDIAQAFLRRAAADTRDGRSARARRHRAELAGRLQDEQRISSLAWLPCVERKFLYRAFDGTEWAPLTTGRSAVCSR